jgi:hypothetical protein
VGQVDEDLDIDLGELTLITAGAVIDAAQFRPPVLRLVLVVTATDAETETRQLSPRLGNRLCVVASRFTQSQLAEARHVLDSHATQWQLLTWGRGVDEQRQPFLFATPFRVITELADWADDLPTGLVRFDPVFAPA